MKGFIYLADVIRISSDGKVGMLGGGISVVAAPPGQPGGFSVSALVRIDASEEPEATTATLTVMLLAPDGKPFVLPAGLSNPLSVPVQLNPGVPVQVVTDLQLVLEARGTYVLEARIADTIIDRWNLQFRDFEPAMK